MDLVTIERATTIQRGVGGVWKNRKYYGHGYFPPDSDAPTMHTDNVCWKLRGQRPRRLPLYEEDGNIYKYDAKRNYYRQVHPCLVCRKQADRSWVEEGACWDNMDERFFDSYKHEEVIEEFCNQCPVVRECFEYAALNPDQVTGSTWGGLYFARNGMGKYIDARRKELDASGVR